MASNLEEEEPMEIDGQDDEEENISVAVPVTVSRVANPVAELPQIETVSSSNSRNETNPLEEISTRLSTESNENSEVNNEADSQQTEFPEMEEITLNEGGVGEGEEAEELQLHLNAPDFGDEGNENDQLLGNEDNSADNMDDPLSRQNKDDPVSNLVEPPDLNQTEDSLEKTEKKEGEQVLSLPSAEDESSLIVSESRDQNLSKSAESPTDESGNDKIEDNNKGDDNSADGDNADNPICIDDEDAEINEVKDSEGETEEDSGPKIRLRMNGIFEQEQEDDEDEDRVMDIQSMLQMSFQEGGQDQETQKKPEEAEEIEEVTPTRRHLPRRAAATAAANTIRKISNVELADDESWSRRGRKEVDKTFRVSDHSHSAGGSSDHKKTVQKCSVCKKYATCPIKIQQFGTDVHLCSTICFNRMRRAGHQQGTKRKLACVKCGIWNQVENQTYYWETMNFCSDVCVGNYQVEVGGKCATCFKKVPWLSLGKYCVRFGSDIRQFCTAGCLESYKKNARVCFHCQLDIKRLGNVILANIPAKNSPKEFCSQDCVEMYVEQNLNQTVKSRSNQLATCVICAEYRISFREIVLPSAVGLKVCSQACWNKMIETKSLTKPVKCEKCTKYVNLEDEFEPPAHYVATEEKMFCFCSATCKNVFVLNNRQILSCTTCKVKKYNYDLVQYFTNQIFSYAVCSLNCLPKTAEYVIRLKNSLLPPSTASELVSRNGNTSVFSEDMDNGSFPVINSVTSIHETSQTEVNTSNPSSTGAPGGLTGIIQAHLQSIATSVVSNSMNTYTMPQQGFNICNVSDSGVYETGDFLTDNGKWDGVLRDSDVLDVLDMLKSSVEMKDKFTMAKSRTKVSETQTDVSELDDMERVPLKTVEIIRYVPIPIPYPVYLPSPTYFCETPVPYPVAVPIPVPVPIPVVFDGVSGKLHVGDSLGTKLKSNGNYSSDQEKCDKSDSLKSINTNTGIDSSNNDIEVMDCAEAVDPSSKSVDESPLPNITTTFTNTVSQPQPDSVVSTNSSNAVHLSSSSCVSLISGSVSEVASSPGGGRRKLTRVEYGIRAWKMTFGASSDPLNLSSMELATKLAEWVKKGTKPNGERYRADIILYLCLGVQQHLRENQRLDSIFYDVTYHPFVKAITEYAESDCAQGIITRIEDSHFWESKELGGSSPGVLLFSLIYFIFKNFNLRTWEKHFGLHFGQIRIDEVAELESGQMYKYMSIMDLPECEGIRVRERVDFSEKCPVRLLELYIQRCEQADGSFYKNISQLDFTTTIKWFTSEPLDKMEIYQMLVRAMMIKTDSDPR